MSMDKIFEKYKKPKISYSEFKEKNYNNLYKFNNTKKIKNHSRMKLCIGVIIIVFVISLGFMLRGGNEPKEKVIVNFIVEGVSYEVEIEKGSLINKELIPLSNKELVLELYYDEKMEREYNFETIVDDIIIYVKVIKNNNISLLKNEFKEDTLITFDFSLEDKINEIKDGRKNQYLIKYIHKEKFYCGYIDEYISKQIEDKLWIKEDNLLYSFKKFLFNNEIEFKFEDIKWIEYNNINDALYKSENYNLQFIFKFNDVELIEDIYGNKINQIISDIIPIDFLVYNDRVKISDYNQLDEGDYFLYGNNFNSFEDVSFNRFITRKYLSTEYQHYILQKINYDDLIIDCIEYDDNGTLIDMFSLKYGIYKKDFENSIKEKKEQGKFVFAYWDYESYKNLFIGILNGREE